MLFSKLKEIQQSLLGLILPPVCPGCGNYFQAKEEIICLECLASLPLTDFYSVKDNQLEKLFWGRAQITHGVSHVYFQKDSPIQSLLHALKYQSKKEVGEYFGTEIGKAIENSSRFVQIDFVIPVPLHPKKEKIRGYNQAAVIGESIANTLNKPFSSSVLVRKEHTDTQTKKSKYERWENVSSIFTILNPSHLENKHVLIVDDVVTTGATLESCIQTLLSIPGVKVSVATIAIA